MAVVLIRPGPDVRRPGQHSGTFRGYQPAFLTAAVSRRCLEQGPVAETCRRRGKVLKLLPALTISDGSLRRGPDISAAACDDVIPVQTAPGGAKRARSDEARSRGR